MSITGSCYGQKSGASKNDRSGNMLHMQKVGAPAKVEWRMSKVASATRNFEPSWRSAT
jgi:hypothetical protein